MTYGSSLGRPFRTVFRISKLLAHHGLDYMHFPRLSSRVLIEHFGAKNHPSTLKVLGQLLIFINEGSDNESDELDNGYNSKYPSNYQSY